MSAAQTVERPAPTDTGAGDDITHATCCCDGHRTAACGKDVAGERWAVPEDIPCVVCADLWPDGRPCPRCHDQTPPCPECVE